MSSHTFSLPAIALCALALAACDGGAPADSPPATGSGAGGGAAAVPVTPAENPVSGADAATTASDAGTSGTPHDATITPVNPKPDSGDTDPPDAGSNTGGGEAGDTPDGGEPDTGTPDAGTTDGGATTATPMYRADGRFIRDAQGRAILLRGVNVSNAYKDGALTEPEFIGAEGFRHLARSGFNAVRLVTEWYALEPEPGVYDAAYVDLVATRVRWAAEAGLYIIIDMHQDVYGPGFGFNGAPRWTCDETHYAAFTPVEPWFQNYFTKPVTACFDAFWKDKSLQEHLINATIHLLARVGGEPLVMGVDPFNEPFWGNFDPGQFERKVLMPFYERLAAAAPAFFADRLLFFEPAVLFNVLMTTELPEPAGAFQGVFAPHYYNLSVERQELYDGNAEAVRQAVAMATAAAGQLGVPWLYGEMGGVMRTPNLDVYLGDLYAALDREWAGGFMWEYSPSHGGFGMLADDGTGWHEHGRAFVRPTVSAVAGMPRALTWDAGARELALQWDEDPAAGGTVIRVPDWATQQGVALTVDGQAAPTGTVANTVMIPGGVGGPREARLRVLGPYVFVPK